MLGSKGRNGLADSQKRRTFHGACDRNGIIKEDAMYVNHGVELADVEELILAGGALEMQEGLSLHRMLSSMKHLNLLSMSDIKFNETNIAGLCLYFDKNPPLRHLNLEYCLDDDAGASLVGSLMETTHLRRVVLDGNRIGDETGRKLIDLINTTKTITHFIIQNHNFSQEIVDEMYCVFSENEAIIECRPGCGPGFNVGFEKLNNERRVVDDDYATE